MKLTNEQIQAILDGAPDGWTHYCTRNRKHFRRDGNSDRLFVWIVGTESWSVPLDNRTRWLERRERLEEILELRQDVERLALALKPFADCAEQIDKDEDDEEWAKFRLLIKDYRAAANAIQLLEQSK